jgi:phage host-nuclease inhibitor protein Gam
MTRIKSAAQRAPQTTEQAVELLDRYAGICAKADKIEAERAAELAVINSAADVLLVPLVAELKDIAAQLKPWWAANVELLTQGKRKSIELGGCQLGYRMTPPKVTFEHGKDEDAAVALMGNGFGERLVRTAIAPDKPAILKLLETTPADDAIALRADIDKLKEIGFGVKQTEQFFVDALAPATIADQAARSSEAAE